MDLFRRGILWTSKLAGHPNRFAFVFKFSSLFANGYLKMKRRNGL